MKRKRTGRSRKLVRLMKRLRYKVERLVNGHDEVSRRAWLLLVADIEHEVFHVEHRDVDS